MKITNIKKAEERQQHSYDLGHLKSNGIKVGDKVFLKNSKRNDRKGSKFIFRWFGYFDVGNLTDHGLASLKNQKSNVL